MPQVLSQEEVDALLKGISGGQIETEQNSAHNLLARSFDFANQDRIIRGRLPTLEMINERFARQFRSTISSTLRKTVFVSVAGTEVIKFGEFMRSIPMPTSLNLIRMDPLRGYALFTVEGKLVFTFIDHFFGGTGASHVKLDGREFTAIEQRVIKKVVDLALEDYLKCWKPVHPVNVEFIRSETNPQFVTIVQPSDIVIATKLNMEIGETSGNIIFCIPYSMIEPIRDKLKSGFQADLSDVDKTCYKRLVNQLQNTKLEVKGILGKAEIKGKDLLSLKEGDIIQLDQFHNSNIDIYIEDILKFKGSTGYFNGSKAVKINEIIPVRRNEE